MIKLDKIMPTIEGAIGYTILQVIPQGIDISKVASTLVVLITALVQIITLFKKKKDINAQK